MVESHLDLTSFGSMAIFVDAVEVWLNNQLQHIKNKPSAFCVHCRPIKADLGIKRSGGDKSPRIYSKSRTWRRGGWGGVDAPGDGLWEKHNNLAMAGTLGSLENLSGFFQVWYLNPGSKQDPQLQPEPSLVLSLQAELEPNLVLVLEAEVKGQNFWKNKPSMDKYTIISPQKMSTNSHTKSASCISLALFWQQSEDSIKMLTSIHDTLAIYIIQALRV